MSKPDIDRKRKALTRHIARSRYREPLPKALLPRVYYSNSEEVQFFKVDGCTFKNGPWVTGRWLP